MNNKMIKGIQIILLVLLLIILGGLISFFTKRIVNEVNGNGQEWWSWKYNLKNQLKNNYSGPMTVAKEEQVKNEGIDQVEINFTSADIEISVADTDVFNIVESTSKPVSEEELFTTIQKQGVLTIKRKKEKVGTVFGEGVSHKVKITIPQNYNKVLSISTTSGDILINDDLTLSLLETHQASGKLESIGNIEVDSFISESTSGEKKLSGIRSKNYKLVAASGSIGVNTLSGKGSLQTTSGDVEVDTLTGDQHEIETSSGSIEINTLLGKSKLSVLSGDIEVNQLTSSHYVISTASGEVEMGDIIGGGEISTASGKISVTYREVKDGSKIQTASGDVEVNVREAVSAKISAKSVSGDIEGNVDISYSDKRQKNAEIQIGESSQVQIEIDTASGSIDINKVK